MISANPTTLWCHYGPRTRVFPSTDCPTKWRRTTDISSPPPRFVISADKTVCSMHYRPHTIHNQTVRRRDLSFLSNEPYPNRGREINGRNLATIFAGAPHNSKSKHAQRNLGSRSVSEPQAENYPQCLSANSAKLSQRAKVQRSASDTSELVTQPKAGALPNDKKNPGCMR